MIYCDTSFLLPLYLPGDNWHAKAVRYHERHLESSPFCFNPWQRWEFRHNLRLSLRETTAIDRVLRRVQEDSDSGKLRHHPFTWPDIFNRADQLSSEHSEQIQKGTVDYWHVAFALSISAEKFMSFDLEQIKLARVAGLDAPDLVRSGRAA